ncbi:TKL protein kinase [Saprolegnia diclina VS20]|uniref:TKL protein kinase n=1 Tax=Saprolegnia diclina (strain VS20) TaxID=1156394 RepID=T0S7A1_SAPDV|nr:TKL protein kinase [Saprolegnia diclina VS20]EQC38537.1 TKL protein kinase [Saprolegnia diclina VS20]|eukprot:XP_008608129.1 TKL protein kinase [Saprolegnia diclina VS20]
MLREALRALLRQITTTLSWVLEALRASTGTSMVVAPRLDLPLKFNIMERGDWPLRDDRSDCNIACRRAADGRPRYSDQENRIGSVMGFTWFGIGKGRQLVQAAKEGDVEQVAMLLRKRANPNAKKAGMTALFYAASSGRVPIAMMLVEAGVDVNKSTSLGEYPIYIAAANGHAEVVQILVTAKANVNKVKKDGDSALYIAAANGHTRIVEMLVAAKADVNKTNKTGDLPIKMAAQGGFIDIVRILIGAKADMNKCDEFGFSTIYVAASHGEDEIVQLLIDAGADMDPSKLFNPIHIATVNGHRNCAKMIKQAMRAARATRALKHVPRDELPRLEYLGSGVQAYVYKSEYHGQDVAVKVFLRRNKASIPILDKEFDLICRLESPNIVQPIVVFRENIGPNEPLQIVTEYMDGGSLATYLRMRREHVPTAFEFSTVELALAITKGVFDLHTNDIMHRNLKSSNVLLSSTGQHIKLSDVGIPPVLQYDRMSDALGAAYWVAPEVLSGEEHTFASDIYSLGIVLAEIETLQRPYANVTKNVWEILDDVKRGEIRPELMADCPPSYRKVVEGCLKRDPIERPNALQVLECFVFAVHANK